MSHGKLRSDKVCLNCKHYVEEKFCPNCGQENVETRQPFYFLFTHFVEDFTHYDGQFWGTIKNLFFNPGKLTKAYLEGKRQMFVPPVKLYIFVSFITFFLFATFPPFNINYGDQKKPTAETEKNQITELKKDLEVLKNKKDLNEEDSIAINKINSLLQDSVKLKEFQSSLDMNTELGKNFNYKGYTNKKSFDSASIKNPSLFHFIDKPIAHKLFELKERGVTKKEILKNLFETSFHNLPKALFIYLPVFAFFLWIFHNKKKWWYFDHGIFTLHYFSFLLLNILALSLLYKISDLANISFINWIIIPIIIALTIYSFVYFFVAHRKVYQSMGFASLIIGFVLLMINYFAFLFLVIGLAYISFLMIH